MNVILHATYPVHSAKAAIQAFLSADIPKRPESAKELASLSYTDPDGMHTVFVFDVPDKDMATFLEIHTLRTSFIGSRAAGFSAVVHAGLPVAEGVPKVLPILAG